MTPTYVLCKLLYHPHWLHRQRQLERNNLSCMYTHSYKQLRHMHACLRTHTHTHFVMCHLVIFFFHHLDSRSTYIHPAGKIRVCSSKKWLFCKAFSITHCIFPYFRFIWTAMAAAALSWSRGVAGVRSTKGLLFTCWNSLRLQSS